MSVSRGSTFRSLHVRNYRLFASGQVVSLIGTWMQFIAQDWLVLSLSDNSGTALGTVTALQFVPVLLLTLYGGKLADRYDKRLLLVGTNTFAGALALILGVLVVTGTAQLWHVFVFAVFLGVSSAVEIPVRQAFVTELVGSPLLPNALSLNGATFNIARILGPAVAGVLIAAIDTGPVFLINGVSYGATVIGLLMMRTSDLHLAEHRPRDTRIRDGLWYVARRPDLMLPIALVLVVGCLGFNFQLTLALLSKTVFHRGAASFGLLTTALAVGALGGALAGSWRTGRPSVYTVVGAGAAFGALEAVTGFAPGYLVAAVLLVPTGFAMIYFAQAANQRIQLGVDASYRGRVMALYTLVFLGSTPIGAPLVGWIGEHAGPRYGLIVGGVASLAAAIAVLIFRSYRRGVRMRLQVRPRLHIRLVEGAADEPRLPVGQVRAAR